MGSQFEATGGIGERIGAARNAGCALLGHSSLPSTAPAACKGLIQRSGFCWRACPLQGRRSCSLLAHRSAPPSKAPKHSRVALPVLHSESHSTPFATQAAPSRRWLTRARCPRPSQRMARSGGCGGLCAHGWRTPSAGSVFFALSAVCVGALATGPTFLGSASPACLHWPGPRTVQG